MMIYKIAGALFLSVSGVLCAAHLNRRAERRVRQIGGWISLLRFVRGQVECFSLPMSEILARCPPEIFAECSFAGDVAPTSFEMLLSASPPDDRASEELLRRFCTEFGRGYREEELRGCDYFLAGLEARRTELSTKLPTQKKMHTTLCLCSALAVVLLLL